MNTPLQAPPRDPSQGSLAIVGMGMTLGSHLTPLSRSHIEQADVVFAGLSDNIVEQWLGRMHPDVRSLQPYYQEGKSRRKTYEEWVDLMMTEVRAGKRVCGVFYGHPGIFAWSPHKVIEVARAEGFQAHMEPGVSAEDCLYADLGIDPGTVGCQHYEAGQLLFYERRLDPSAYLVLWQVGLVGDRSLARFTTGGAYRQVLVDVLNQDYPLDHEIILYRAVTLPIQKPRIRRIALRDLPHVDVPTEETVILPPASPLKANMAIRERLAALDKMEKKKHRPLDARRTIYRVNHHRKENDMLDTIEMLEAIGRDASLRHASAHDLTAMLEKAHASKALTAAVSSGDSSELFAELGFKLMQVPQVNQFYCGPA